jgi:phosphoenolpyruvate carboxykinase (ATP)
VNLGTIHHDVGPAALVEQSLAQGLGRLTDYGALSVSTGVHTGRSAKDKYIVKEPGSEDRVWWDANVPLPEAKYFGLRDKLTAWYQGREIWVVDAQAGADPEYAMRVRVVTPSPWHALFARTLFRAPVAGLPAGAPQGLVLHAPNFVADPAEDGTRTSTAIALHLSRREVLVAGTEYAGEIKKSIFTLMNDHLPQSGVFSMHCSANVDDDGRSAVFFGLSGTGKTTLSADPDRHLIGDDEHGWSDQGIFNVEGGCYAKMIHLKRSSEPEIWDAVHRFAAVLENVVLDEFGEVQFDDSSKTENTRGAYPLSYIPNHLPEAMAGHPNAVVMLTADAFGVLPPISRLTPEQAKAMFVVGYTSKLAGTEIGVTEPSTTFSACFGAPFLPQPPSVYAGLLGEKLEKHGAVVWLINTGWTGGPYGTGHRMPIAATRAMLAAALDGTLDKAEFRTDPVFGFEVPVSVPGMDPELAGLLDPRSTWDDKDYYDTKAQKLAGMFAEQARKMGVDAALLQAASA